MLKIDNEIKAFLDGGSNLKYLTKIEKVPNQCVGSGFFHNPETGSKWCDYLPFKSFVYVNKDINLDWALKPFDVKVEKLMTNNWSRLKNGYNLKLTCEGSPYKIMQFLKKAYQYHYYDTMSEEQIKEKFKEHRIKHTFEYKNGKANPPPKTKVDKMEWDDVYKHKIHKVTTNEQLMVEQELRIYKGIENYSDLHKLYYDIETEGLEPKTDRIFQIGVLLNYDPENPTKKGERKVYMFEVEKPKDDESEREILIEFFKTINYAIPDMIIGHNVFNFDWKFIFTRCEVLGLNPNEHITPKFDLIEKTEKLKRSNILNTIRGRVDKRGAWSLYEDRHVKLGNESGRYDHRQLFGYNVVDSIHAARRAQAINKSIKSVGLKWLAEHHNVAKENRVYVPGSKIFNYWYNDYKFLAFTKDNRYYQIKDVNGLKDFYYHCENIDWLEDLKKQIKKDHSFESFDEETYTLLMSNDPDIVYDLIEFNPKAKNTDKPLQVLSGKHLVREYLKDDLHETIEVDEIYGQSTFLTSKLVPTDFEKLWVVGNSSIWNLLMLSWYYKKNVAIPSLPEERGNTGGINRCILIGHSKRVFKADFGSLYPSIGLKYDLFPLFDEDRVMGRMLSTILGLRLKYKKLKNEAKAKGDKNMAVYYDLIQLPLKIIANSYYGAMSSSYFNWADADFGEKIPVLGRLHMRKFVKYMIDKGYKPLVMNTDGCNFVLPEDRTIEDADADIEYYNDTFLDNPMLMEFEDYFDSEINLSKNNYSDYDAKTGKMKNTGGTLIKKGMPTYQKDFLNEALMYIHKDDPQGFLQAYRIKLGEIIEQDIPAVDISDKHKVKYTYDSYQARFEKTTKSGKKPPKLAYMELLIQEGIEKDIGDHVYVANIGEMKSHTKTEHKVVLEEETLMENPDYKVGYNVPFYLNKFINGVEPLLCVFDEETEGKIKSIKSLEDFDEIDFSDVKFTTRLYLNESAKEKGIETYDDMISDIFTLEPKEIDYWVNRTFETPSSIFPEYIIPVVDEPIAEACKELMVEVSKDMPMMEKTNGMNKKEERAVNRHNRQIIEERKNEYQKRLTANYEKYYRIDIWGEARKILSKRDEFYNSEYYRKLKSHVKEQPQWGELKSYGEYFIENDLLMIWQKDRLNLKYHKGGAIFEDIADITEKYGE